MQSSKKYPKSKPQILTTWSCYPLWFSSTETWASSNFNKMGFLLQPNGSQCSYRSINVCRHPASSTPNSTTNQFQDRSSAKQYLSKTRTSCWTSSSKISIVLLLSNSSLKQQYNKPVDNKISMIILRCKNKQMINKSCNSCPKSKSTQT